MTMKHYKVVRETHNHSPIIAAYPEYASGYRMYMVEMPTTSAYNKQLQYLLTRETLQPSQFVSIDEGTELLSVNSQNSAIHLGGHRVFLYRPAHYLEEDFRIVSAVQDGEPVERFGGKEMDRRVYTLYEAKREAKNGYNAVLVRIFTKALYAPGMGIPADETVGLPLRGPSDKPHYYHDTDSKTYRDRIWKALKSFC